MKACYINLKEKNKYPNGVLWVKALQADEMSFDQFILSCKSECPYNVILVDVTLNGYSIIKNIQENLSCYPNTILILMVNEFIPETTSLQEEFKKTLELGDILLVSSQSIVEDIKKYTGLQAYVLNPPIETGSSKSLSNVQFKYRFTVVANHRYTFIDFVRDFGLPMTIWSTLRYSIRFITDRDENKLKESIAKSKFVYLPKPLQDGGRIAVYCAMTGSILIADRCYDAGKVCFPYTMFDSKHKRRPLILLWLYTSRSFREFFIENAGYGFVNFNSSNKLNSFFNRIQYNFSHLSRICISNGNALIDQIQYLSGRKEVEYEEDECVVVCLLRNGEEFLHSFLRHYRSLGVKHFFFIDNGSDDLTIPLLLKEIDGDVTIYTTDLPHKYYENEIRRLIIEKHCKHRWCLNVDIDELFDYPYSDRMTLEGLLSYLRNKKYTALAGYMLDMFNKDNTFGLMNENDLRKNYPYYDISNIEKKEYHAFDVIAYCDYNQLSTNKIKCYFGGIRKTVFSSKIAGHYLLTKHPLIYLDGILEPVTNPHYCNKASVADISCVLYHYKFTPGFKERVIESKKTSRYIKFAQNQYNQYYKKIAGRESMIIDTPGMRRLNDVNELLENDFLTVSDSYLNYVGRRTKKAEIKVAI